METKQEQLTVLHRLQSEGRITAAEYSHLVAGLGGSDQDEPGLEYTDADPSPDGSVPPEDGSEPTLGLPAPRLRDGLTGSMFVLAGVVGLGLIIAASTGLISWLFTLPALGVLATTLLDGWGVVTRVGTVILAGAVVIWALSSLDGADQPIPATTVATLPPPIEAAAEGSLGLRMDEIADTWNTLDGEPRITKGLTRYSESGDYDTFVYRFGDWGRLAGAYDRETDSVYALMATGRLDQPATSLFYLRLCFMTAPYSQECVDSYLEHGLGDIVVEDREDEYREEWTVGAHTWRLTIEGDLMTIRVFGADAA